MCHSAQCDVMRVIYRERASETTVSGEPLDLARGKGAFPAHGFREGSLDLLYPRKAAVVRIKMHHDAMPIRVESDIREYA